MSDSDDDTDDVDDSIREALKDLEESARDAVDTLRDSDVDLGLFAANVEQWAHTTAKVRSGLFEDVDDPGSLVDYLDGPETTTDASDDA